MTRVIFPPPYRLNWFMQKLVLCFMFAVLALSLEAAVAQETDTMPKDERVVIETKDKDGLASKGLKLEKEVKPRLPNGFAPVVDAAQKEKIYSFQREYNTLIAMLELRIELLKKERDAKIESTLTPTQLEKVRIPSRRSRTN
ncbi:MAG: hypothetical protein LBI05_09240 [Planctomycetaceae bacterium]|jgi:Spy/CpxP family protein refolding chaperone|nr:hypothetical protein [Planctomycetaceae bacterium]